MAIFSTKNLDIVDPSQGVLSPGIVTGKAKEL